MINFPIIKKKINAFLKDEEGKISKTSLIKSGTIITIGIFSSLVNLNNFNVQGTHYDHLNTPNIHNNCSASCGDSVQGPSSCPQTIYKSSTCTAEHSVKHTNSASCNFEGDTDLAVTLKMEHNHNLHDHTNNHLHRNVYCYDHKNHSNHCSHGSHGNTPPPPPP
jgi:hypothetical protein